MLQPTEYYWPWQIFPPRKSQISFVHRYERNRRRLEREKKLHSFPNSTLTRRVFRYLYFTNQPWSCHWKPSLPEINFPLNSTWLMVFFGFSKPKHLSRCGFLMKGPSEKGGLGRFSALRKSLLAILNVKTTRNRNFLAPEGRSWDLSRILFFAHLSSVTLFAFLWLFFLTRFLTNSLRCYGRKIALKKISASSAAVFTIWWR